MRNLAVSWLGAVAVVVLWAGHAAAAPPDLPHEIPYQGVLLDSGGQPRTGNVDLELRLYDAAVGGTLVYTQLYTSVALSDGVFDVVLGPTGETTDTPVDPLTDDLATALGGDAGATAPLRFLEVTVGADPPLPRTQVLAVPYALRAESAETADLADTATTAITALDATQVSGLSGDFVTELYEHGNSDGQGPVNNDPAEGLGDTDGDGIANFIDPDNDDDGLDDDAEVAAGSDLNLVTPTLASASVTGPLPGPATLDATGTSFETGMAVRIDGVTLLSPTIDPTSLSVSVTAIPAGSHVVEVERLNGESATIPLVRALPVLPVASAAAIEFVSLRRMLLADVNTYSVADVDESLGTVTPIVTDVSGIGVTGDPAGRLVGLENVENADLDVELRIDTDDDRVLEASEGTLIETIVCTSSPCGAETAALAHDGAGRVFGIYERSVRVGPTITRDFQYFLDANDDGTIAAGERTTLEVDRSFGFPPPRSVRAFTDASGNPVVVYTVDEIGNSDWVIRVAWDRNGDGDFDDNVGGLDETFEAERRTGTYTCVAPALDASGNFALLHSVPFIDDLFLTYDRNGDGDFDDTDEFVRIDGLDEEACGFAFEGATAVAVGLADDESPVGTGAVVVVDADGDAVFEEAGESLVLDGAGTAGLVLGKDSDGVYFAVGGGLAYPFEVPFPVVVP